MIHGELFKVCLWIGVKVRFLFQVKSRFCVSYYELEHTSIAFNRKPFIINNTIIFSISGDELK